MGALEHEELRVVLLDTKNFVKRVVTVYKGNLNSAIVRIGELFRDAIRHNAASIVLVHNHPGGTRPPAPKTCVSPRWSWRRANSTTSPSSIT